MLASESGLWRYAVFSVISVHDCLLGVLAQIVLSPLPVFIIQYYAPYVVEILTIVLVFVHDAFDLIYRIPVHSSQCPRDFEERVQYTIFAVCACSLETIYDVRRLRRVNYSDVHPPP